MASTKRKTAGSDFSLFNNDTIEKKRYFVGSAFEAQRTEPTQQQHLIATRPPLDMQRAESSRQHVRALNTQFASWIQAQLEKHPDELWEDGVQDYLNHAKTIMEKFSDVVSWLKVNAAKSEKESTIGSDTSPKKVGSDSTEKDIGVSFGVPVTPPASTTASFAAPQALGSPFHSNAPITFGLQSSVVNSSAPITFGLQSSAVNSSAPITFGFQSSVVNSSAPITIGLQSPVVNSSSPTTFGLQSSLVGNQIQNSISLNVGGSNDLDGEESAEQPSSPSVKKAEEKGIKVVHEVRCKLLVKSSDPNDEDQWKNKGTGQLSIKCNEDVDKGTKESKPTIVVRNDVGKLLLNASIYPGIKTTFQKNSILAIFHTMGDGDDETVKARMFSIRTRSEEERNKLAEVIKEYSPAA